MNEMKLHTAADSIPGSVTLFGMETPFCSLPLGQHCLGACSRACVKCHETITIGGGTMNNKPKTAQTRTTPYTKHKRQSHSRSSHPSCSLWTLSVTPHVWVSCYQCWGSWLYAFKAVLWVQQCCRDWTYTISFSNPQAVRHVQQHWTSSHSIPLVVSWEVIFITFKLWKITGIRKLSYIKHSYPSYNVEIWCCSL